MTVSTMCTGMRIVRAWSATARDTAWRIHQRRVGRELVAAGVVELLDGADQAEVALLDQVEERQPAAGVALGDRHDQPQVGLDQPLLGALAVADDGEQVAAQVEVGPWSPERLSRSAAKTPASTRLARSTSSAAVSSGTRPISRR